MKQTPMSTGDPRVQEVHPGGVSVQPHGLFFVILKENISISSPTFNQVNPVLRDKKSCIKAGREFPGMADVVGL